MLGYRYLAALPLNRRPLVLIHVNVALPDPDGIVPQNGRQRGKVEPLLALRV